MFTICLLEFKEIQQCEIHLGSLLRHTELDNDNVMSAPVLH